MSIQNLLQQNPSLTQCLNHASKRGKIASISLEEQELSAGKSSPSGSGRSIQLDVLPRHDLAEQGGVWYSVDLCEDARPFAPSMSCGSRANQDWILKRLSSAPSYLNTPLSAGNRRFVSVCRYISWREIRRTHSQTSHRRAVRCL